MIKPRHSIQIILAALLFALGSVSSHLDAAAENDPAHAAAPAAQDANSQPKATLKPVLPVRGVDEKTAPQPNAGLFLGIAAVLLIVRRRFRAPLTTLSTLAPLPAAPHH